MFVLYVFTWKLIRLFFKKLESKSSIRLIVGIPLGLILFAVFSFASLLLARGGWQQKQWKIYMKLHRQEGLTLAARITILAPVSERLLPTYLACLQFCHD